MKNLMIYLFMFYSGLAFSQADDFITCSPILPEPPQVELQKPAIEVHGRVEDKRTKQALPFATVHLYEIDLDGELIPLDTFRTSQDGRYHFPLEANRKYVVVGNSPEYYAFEENFETQTAAEKIEVNLRPELDRCPYTDQPLVLENLYFRSGTIHPLQASLPELEKLINLLLKNPHIRITIIAHCDSIEARICPEEITRARAHWVKDFLVLSGISPDRLFTSSMGYSQPLIYPELNEEDELLNRRVEFRIKDIEFSYPPASTESPGSDEPEKDTSKINATMTKAGSQAEKVSEIENKPTPTSCLPVSGILRSCPHKESIPFATVVLFTPDIEEEIFPSLQLGQNYPNPFHQSTTIPYELPWEGRVKLNLYNLNGIKVKTIVDEFQQAGTHSAVVNSADLVPGNYFYKIECGELSAVKKLVLIQ